MNSNQEPTLKSVKAKLDRPGALFAADEVQVVLDKLNEAENDLAVLRVDYDRLHRAVTQLTQNA